jgi:hypothetical protein
MAALPFETPKLIVTALISGGDFGARLDRAIKMSKEGPVKIIEHSAREERNGWLKFLGFCSIWKKLDDQITSLSGHQIRQKGPKAVTLSHFLIWSLIAGHLNLKMAIKVRGGVMSTDGSTNNVTAIEIDMRDALRARKSRSDVSRDAGNDYSGLVAGISVRSIQEVDHLIEGLQGLRHKLNSDGDRLHRAISQHAAFSQSIVDLTKIVSDAMTSVSKSGGA